MVWTSQKLLVDGTDRVTKIVLTNDTAVSEVVLYKYPTYEERTVICCSSQSGCPIGCRFCGAGDAFVRSLTKEEIVLQVDIALGLTDCEPNKIKRLQIMAMSMGEPMLNIKNLGDAFIELHEKYPSAALLISTSAPRVEYESVIELSKNISTVGLQFSVHESTDAARDLLIPFKSKLTLAEIAEMGERWYSEVGRKPFFNYCAHAKNVAQDDADRLYALFNPEIWCATVSVICERSEGFQTRNEFQRSLAQGFAEKLVMAGYDTRMFDPAGQDDVGGGCGQLPHAQKWFRDNSELVKPSCGANKAVVHVPSDG